MELLLLCRQRWVRTKLKQFGFFACLLLLFLFCIKMDKVTDVPAISVPASYIKIETFNSLQAELGYLRRKLVQYEDNSLNFTHLLSPIYIITPTYSRPVQKAELTRLLNVFLMVPSIHWLVVEDSVEKTGLVNIFLARSGIQYTHLNVVTPSHMKLKPKDPHWTKSRGVYQRNLAIQWLRDNREKDSSGVVYFADDDNTYCLELFEAMRETKTVSAFPVGLVGGLLVERPMASASGKVGEWSVNWGRDRPFATDMAGFAIKLSFLLAKPNAKFADKTQIGWLESDFLRQLVSGKEEVDVVSVDKVMVWHTRTEKVNLNMEQKFIKRTGHGSDHGIEI